MNNNKMFKSPDSCIVCGDTATFLCGQCKSVMYCNRQCAQKDWIVKHSLICVSAKTKSPLHNLRQLMEFEYKFNQGTTQDAAKQLEYSVVSRENEFIKDGQFEALCYYVPIDETQKFAIDSPIAKKIEERLRIKNELGMECFKWFINPEDTMYHILVRNFLEENNFPASTHVLGKGYLSASRTCYVEIDSEFALFFKVSTNRTGGKWTDKKHATLEEAVKSFAASKEFHEILSNDPNVFEVFVPILDPFSLWIPKVGNSIIVRHIELESDKILVPGFTALHERKGKWIPRQKEDFTEPTDFWKKWFARKAGIALAESLAQGIYFHSFHSQNILIEMTDTYEPTGRIFVRDMASCLFYRECFTDDVLRDLSLSEDMFVKNIEVTFSLFAGTGFPSWICTEEAKKWSRAYFSAFFETFQKLSGIDMTKGLEFYAGRSWNIANAWFNAKQNPSPWEHLTLIRFDEISYPYKEDDWTMQIENFRKQCFKK